MIFKEKKIIHKVLESLFKTYSERVPDVKKITNGLIKYKVIEKQEDIINDHIAFRTLGVKHLGIQSLEKIFIHHGYEKRDYYNFDKKKLIDTASGDIYVKLANEGIEWAKTYVKNGKGVPNKFLNESKLTGKGFSILPS